MFPPHNSLRVKSHRAGQHPERRVSGEHQTLRGGPVHHALVMKLEFPDCLEGVWDMEDVGLIGVAWPRECEDIEADSNFPEQAVAFQEADRGQGDSALLLVINAGGDFLKISRGSGPHLHNDECAAIQSNQVNFAAPVSKVVSNDPIPETAKKLSGSAFGAMSEPSSPSGPTRERVVGHCQPHPIALTRRDSRRGMHKRGRGVTPEARPCPWQPLACGPFSSGRFCFLLRLPPPLWLLPPQPRPLPPRPWPRPHSAKPAVLCLP